MFRLPRSLTILALATVVYGLTACQTGSIEHAASTPASDSTSHSSASEAGSVATAGRVIPAGAPEIVAAATAQGAKATLLNVWATWCGPCREEFPDLVRLERDYRDRGMRLVLVSADFDDQIDDVKEFLARHGVTADSYLKTGDDMAFIDGLHPQWSGALPATLVYDADGNLIRFWEGRADYAKFESAVIEAMNGATASR